MVGNDSIALESGTWSNLSIKAGDNADTIAISTGTTVSTKTSYFGAKGADSISVLTDDVSTSSSVYAGMGHDTIVIGESAETTYVVGGFGNDSVLLNSGSDTSLTIVGGGMADTINLGSSFEGLIYGDTLTEGSNDGADTIGSTAQALIGASSVYGGGGSDTIAFSCQAEAAVLSGGSAGDRIEVDHVGTAITIDGGKGADTIVLSSHVSAGGSVLGGAGADTINLNSSFGGGLTVDGGAGVDTITFDAVSALTIKGGSENDLIKSSAQDLVLCPLTVVLVLTPSNFFKWTLLAASAVVLATTPSTLVVAPWQPWLTQPLMVVPVLTRFAWIRSLLQTLLLQLQTSTSSTTLVMSFN